MGKSSPPSAPNYTAAAQATAGGNLANSVYSNTANMVNQVSPQGKVTYTQSPTGSYVNTKTGSQISGDEYNALTKNQGDYSALQQWTQNVEMSPEQQALYNQSNRINQGLGDAAEQGVSYVQSALDKPLTDPGKYQRTAGTTQFVGNVDAPTLQTQLGNTQNQIVGNISNNANQIRTAVNDPNLVNQQVQDALYQQQTQYLDPQFQKSQARLENQLANQGITRGSEAWNSAMQDFGNQKQQAYESARSSAIGQGVNAASTLYGNQLAGIQTGNQALGQQFEQGLQTGQFANTAQQQEYQQMLARMEAQNTAMGNQFNMGVTNANLANTAANARYAQDLSNVNLYNQGLQSDFQNAQTLQQNPINILNAVRSGQQMTAGAQPQTAVSAPSQMATVAGPDILGATSAQYNAQLGAVNAQNAANSGMLSGIGSLGMGLYGLSKI